jgi:uncharacterized membrane protein YfcA
VKSSNNKLPQVNPSLFKYLGLSFQMFAVIGLGTALGWYIQSKSQMKFPIWLLLFCFLSIVVAFYQLYINMKNDEREQENRKKKP